MPPVQYKHAWHADQAATDKRRATQFSPAGVGQCQGRGADKRFSLGSRSVSGAIGTILRQRNM